MDEAAINKLVEERVAAALAARQTDEAEQSAIRQRMTEDKMRKDSALMRQAAQGRDEARPRGDENANYGDSARIANALKTNGTFLDFAGEIEREVEAYQRANGIV